MAPTAGSTVFLDTNILIYASFPSSIFHAVTRSKLIDLETSGAILWASRQVLREFLALQLDPATSCPYLKRLPFPMRSGSSKRCCGLPMKTLMSRRSYLIW